MPHIGGPVKHAEALQTRAEMHELGQALRSFAAKHGHFPNQTNWAAELEADGYRFSYRDLSREDAWGTPYRYSLVSGKLKIRSAGPDALFDTKDDITE